MHKLTEATIARTFRQSPLLVRALAFIPFAAHAVMRPQPPERSPETTQHSPEDYGNRVIR